MADDQRDEFADATEDDWMGPSWMWEPGDLDTTNPKEQ